MVQSFTDWQKESSPDAAVNNGTVQSFDEWNKSQPVAPTKEKKKGIFSRIYGAEENFRKSLTSGISSFAKDYGKNVKQGVSNVAQMGTEAALKGTDIVLQGLDFATRETIRNTPRLLHTIKDTFNMATEKGSAVAILDPRNAAESNKRKAEVDKKVRPWEEAFDRAVTNNPTPFATAREKLISPIQKKVAYKPTEKWNKAYQNNDWGYMFGKGADETIRTIAPGALGSLLPVLAMAPLPGGAAIVTGVFGASTADQVYKDGIKAGADPDKLRKTAMLTGLVVGMLERTGAEGIIHKPALKVFGKRFGSFLVGALSEGSTEGLQEKAQIAAERTFKEVGVNEEKSRTLLSAFAGALVGGPMASIISGSNEPVVPVLNQNLPENMPPAVVPPDEPPPPGGTSAPIPVGPQTAIQQQINRTTGVGKQSLSQSAGQYAAEQIAARTSQTPAEQNISQSPFGGVLLRRRLAAQAGQVQPNATPAPATAPTIQPTTGGLVTKPATPQVPGQNMAPTTQPIVQPQIAQAPATIAQPQPAPVTPSPAPVPVNTAEVNVVDPKQFYIRNKNTGAFIPINGTPIKDFPGIDLFVTPAIGPDGGFSVNEGKSGQQIAWAKTKPEVLAKVRQLVANTYDQFPGLVQTFVNKGGLSPRYTTAPVVEDGALAPTDRQKLAEMGINPAVIAKAAPKPLYTETKNKPRTPLTGATQEYAVSQAVAGAPKTAGQVAEETGILEPNVRRILGMGAKEGKFTRVERGVYVLSRNGKDIAWIETADAIEALPRLAAAGFKADMIFLDIPYNTVAVKGGNRGVKYDLISPQQFDTAMAAISDIVENDKTPVVYMYSTAPSGQRQMNDYNKVMLDYGFLPVEKGFYRKTFKDGRPATNPRGEPVSDEAIVIFSRSGDLNKILPPNALQYTFVRPTGGWQTEKPEEMMRQIVDLTTENGDTVLDPFAGSGAMPAAAVKEGRKAYAIEKSPQAVEQYIKPRVEAAIAQAPVKTAEETRTQLVNVTPKGPEISKLDKKTVARLVQTAKESPSYDLFESRMHIEEPQRKIIRSEFGSIEKFYNEKKVEKVAKVSQRKPVAKTEEEYRYEPKILSKVEGPTFGKLPSTIVRGPLVRVPARFTNPEVARQTLMDEYQALAKEKRISRGEVEKGLRAIRNAPDDRILQINTIKGIDSIVAGGRWWDGVQLGQWDSVHRILSLSGIDFGTTTFHELSEPIFRGLDKSIKDTVISEWRGLSRSQKIAVFGSEKTLQKYERDYPNEEALAGEYVTRQGERLFNNEKINAGRGVINAIKTILRRLSDAIKKLFGKSVLDDLKISPAVRSAYKAFTDQSTKIANNSPGETVFKYSEPVSEEVSFKDLPVNSSTDLSFEDALVEANAAATGWTSDFEGRVVVEKVGDKYNVLSGNEILRGLQRREAKGMGATDNIKATVIDMTPEMKEDLKTSDFKPVEGVKDEVNTEAEKIETKSKDVGAQAAADTKKAEGVIAKVFGWASRYSRVITNETLAKNLQAPHQYFPELFADVYVDGILPRDAYIYDMVGEMNKVFEEFDIRVGSKEEKMVTSLRNGNIDYNNVLAKYGKERADNLVAFSEAWTKRITDKLYLDTASKAGIKMGYRKHYVKTSKKASAVARYSTMTEVEKKELGFTKKGQATPEYTMYEGVLRNVRELADKIYLEPQLLRSAEVAETVYKDDPIKYKEAKKWLDYVQDPYKIPGTVERQNLFRFWRVASSLYTQLSASTYLGIRTGAKNIAWGEGMLIGEVGMQNVLAAHKFMASKEGRKIISEQFPHLIEQAMPLVYGTFGSAPTRLVRNISRLQKFQPSQALQLAGELYLRQLSVSAGYLQGQKMGLKGNDLIKHANMVVVKTQQIYTPVDMPHAFRGPMGRILGQFVMPSIKQSNEQLTNLHNKKFWTFGRWSVASSVLMGALSMFWPKKDLLTKDGKTQYSSGGINAWEGIDSFGIRNIAKARTGGEVLGLLAEQFMSPGVKDTVHRFGWRIVSDAIYNKFATQEQINARGNILPQKVTIKDIINLTEIFGGKPYFDIKIGDRHIRYTGDNKYINSAVGLGVLRREDPEKFNQVKTKYSYLIPLIGKANTADKKLRQIAQDKSEDKKKLANKLKKDIKDLSDGELKEINQKYDDKEAKVLLDFNRQVGPQNLLFTGGETSAAPKDKTVAKGPPMGLIPTASAATQQYSGGGLGGGSTGGWGEPSLPVVENKPGLEAVGEHVTKMEGVTKKYPSYNNPGAIMHNSRLVHYPTPQAGKDAMLNTIMRYARQGYNVEDFIRRYVNDDTVAARIRQFSAQFKVTPRTPLIKVINQK